MNIELKDRKILCALSKNSRLTNKELGKNVGLHKDTIAYRLKQLSEKGIISGHTMFFDFSKLGFHVYKLYIQIKGITAKKLQQLAKELVSDKEIGWIVLCNGRWDMILGVISKNINQFFQKKQDIENTFNPFLEDMKVTSHVQAFLYSRDYLVAKSPPTEIRIFSREKSSKIDNKDLKILGLLGSNSRMSSVEIAKKTNLTPRIVAYRIKVMEKSGVILQYRSSINLEKINYIFVKAFIKLQNITTKDRTKILEYCKVNPNIVHNVECLGDWDLEPEFEVPSIEDFYKIVDEMRNLFSKNIKNIESVIINRELKYQYLAR